MVDHGVRNEHGQIRVLEWDEFGLAAAAVDEDKAVRFSEGGGVLVHNTAGDVGEIVLGFLAEQRLLAGLKAGV